MVKEIACHIDIIGSESDNTKSECSLPLDQLIDHVKNTQMQVQELEEISVTSDESNFRNRVYTDAYIKPSDFYDILSFLEINLLTPTITTFTLSQEIATAIERST